MSNDNNILLLFVLILCLMIIFVRNKWFQVPIMILTNVLIYYFIYKTSMNIYKNKNNIKIFISRILIILFCILTSFHTIYYTCF